MLLKHFQLLYGLGLVASQLHAQVTPDAEAAAKAAQVQETMKKDVKPFVKVYCMECHSNRRSKGGLNLEVALGKLGDASLARKWMEAAANVSAHDMPPDDADQPPEEERERFLAAVAQIKYLATRDPGHFVIRRLTKAEYGNTLHDLLGVDASIAKALPDEVPGEGYLNSLSPMQTEQYLAIANEALRLMPAAAEKRLLGSKDSAVRDVALRLARSAYRRPATDAEVDVLVKVYELGLANGLERSAALRLMLKGVLVSPQFLFITPAKDAPEKEKFTPLDDHQLASRLSYLLWASMPDVELSRLADEGRLHEPEVMKAQAKRLMGSSRSRALFDGFGAQWLGLSQLSTKTFDAAKFPQMTPPLRSAMYDEARLFFDSILRENRSVGTFINADYTFMNATLAEHYGMKAKGEKMQKVVLKDANRGGILAMPGVLASSSFATRTSAVNRGVWVLEQVLGKHIPPAPPNVPTLEKQDPKKTASMTLRQRTEMHRKNPVCANCHKILDPIGFGLENFDAIGRWRDKDESGGPIDAVGELPGGEHFSSPKELKAIIATRQEELAHSLAEKLLAYALCRQLEGYDLLVVDQIMKVVARDGFKMQSLITEIVTSYPFMNRRVKEEEVKQRKK
jgi:hypothetical protein